MENFQRQFILALMAYASKRDIDPTLACVHSGLELQTLITSSNANIPPEKVESLWKNLVRLSNDPLFGLHFGESMQLAALGIIGQIIQTSKNVGEALTTAGTLIGLVTKVFTMQIERGGKTFTIHLVPDENRAREFPFTYRQMAEYLMVFIVHELDGLVLQKVTPLAARFPFEITNQNEFRRVMRCDVKGKSSELSIQLNSDYLHHQIISADYGIQTHLLGSIKKFLNTKHHENSFKSKLFNFLVTNSYLNDMSLESTAANFNMSKRTLQRKLKDEGISFQHVANEVRKELAVCYLSSGNYQVKAIAHMLGYKEQTALIRAFKKWTGKTPGDYLLLSQKSSPKRSHAAKFRE